MISCFLYSLLLFSELFLALNGRPLQTDSPARFYAAVGDDVILPCPLPMPDITFVYVVEWFRTDPHSLRQTVVHAVRNGLALVKDQDPEYRGRTSIMANGSLELLNVKLGDYGNLNCKVLRPQSESDEVASVSLIQAKVSEINLTVHQSVVHCKSSGWSPEPLISLVNTMGNPLPAQMEPPVEEDGLFTVSVHLNITAFRGTETVTCRVEIPGSHLLREKTISVTDDLDSVEEDYWNPVIYAMPGIPILLLFSIIYMGLRAPGLVGAEAVPPAPDVGPLQDILAMTTRGASEDTARRNKSELLIGVEASYQLAAQDWTKIQKYWHIIISVGQLLRVHPALIAAIISRQCRGGTQLNSSGYGIFDLQCYGLMQINTTYHVCKGEPYSSEHLEQGATFLNLLIETMKKKKKTWTREQQLKGALACYIAGTEKVLLLDDPDEADSVTPGGDFANDVVARAQWFADHAVVDMDSAQ